jgi:hypothetical protein
LARIRRSGDIPVVDQVSLKSSETMPNTGTVLLEAGEGGVVVRKCASGQSQPTLCEDNS